MWTDHKAVHQLLQQPDAIGRRSRWMAILSEFNFHFNTDRGCNIGMPVR